MRRMAKITGRSDDMLIVRGVNLFPSQVEEQILRDPALSGHYVIELTRTGALDDLLVRVEARVVLDGEATGRSAAELARRLKGMCGLSATVEVAASGHDRALDGQGAPRDRQATEGLAAPQGRAEDRGEGQDRRGNHQEIDPGEREPAAVAHDGLRLLGGPVQERFSVLAPRCAGGSGRYFSSTGFSLSTGTFMAVASAWAWLARCCSVGGCSLRGGGPTLRKASRTRSAGMPRSVAIFS